MGKAEKVQSERTEQNKGVIVVDYHHFYYYYYYTTSSSSSRISSNMGVLNRLEHSEERQLHAASSEKGLYESLLIEPRDVTSQRCTIWDVSNTTLSVVARIAIQTRELFLPQQQIVRIHT